MRIAFAVPNFPPEFQGGTERVTLALARALQRAGDEVFVLSGSERPHAGQDLVVEQDLGVEVLRLPRLPGEGYGLDLRRPRLLTAVEDQLLLRAADVLHVHHWSGLSIRLLRSARVLGLGALATLHDMWTSCGRFFRRPPPGITCPPAAGRDSCGPCAARDLQAPLANLRQGIAIRDREIAAELAAAHALATPSRRAAELVRTHVPWDGPLHVIPHGLLEPVAGQATSRAGRSPGAPRDGAPLRIGTYGNLVAEKGIGDLVQAMAGVDAELHLFGPFLAPGYEREIDALAARHGVRLSRHGPYAPGGAHPAVQLDLAVFPSLCEETYGLVVEEALARGVPVVVSDRGALAERIGGGGLVVPAGSVEGLRAALQSFVADHPLRERLRAALPRSFATIDDAAARYRELYAQARGAR
jgi:glycosyltransferase involved in cell wall biosynthesis